MRCVADWLLADPENCWLKGDCKYWSKTLEKCMYEERKKAELETAKAERERKA